MAPRKKTFNAFYYFMLDFKARCERNGDHFPNGLKDVMEDAGMEWDVSKISYIIISMYHRHNESPCNHKSRSCNHFI